MMTLRIMTKREKGRCKDVRFNCTHYIIFKLNNKRELQNIAINHSADIELI